MRYNTLTSALDAVLLVLLLPRWGLGGYIFAFAATHLLNFTLSLRRLLIVTGCPLRLGAALGVGACTGAGALAAQLLPELESDPAGLLLRAAVFSGVFILAGVSQRNGGALSAAEPAGAAVSAGTQRKNAQMSRVNAKKI